jgi:hypothetical protein
VTRRPRAAFVITTSSIALGSCAGADSGSADSSGATASTAASVTLTSQPLPDTAATTTTSSTALGSSAPKSDGLLNARDAKGRAIFRTGSKGQPECYVELPFPPLKPNEERYPGTPPPQESVKCPPSMLDAAFLECAFGTVTLKEARCECFVMGNPPPPPRTVSCPK